MKGDFSLHRRLCKIFLCFCFSCELNQVNATKGVSFKDQRDWHVFQTGSGLLNTITRWIIFQTYKLQNVTNTEWVKYQFWKNYSISFFFFFFKEGAGRLIFFGSAAVLAQCLRATLLCVSAQARIILRTQSGVAPPTFHQRCCTFRNNEKARERKAFAFSGSPLRVEGVSPL